MRLASPSNLIFLTDILFKMVLLATLSKCTYSTVLTQLQKRPGEHIHQMRITTFLKKSSMAKTYSLAIIFAIFSTNAGSCTDKIANLHFIINFYLTLKIIFQMVGAGKIAMLNIVYHQQPTHNCCKYPHNHVLWQANKITIFNPFCLARIMQQN